MKPVPVLALFFALLLGQLTTNAQIVWDTYAPEAFNPADGSWTALPRCDDCFQEVQMPFSYTLYGTPYSSVFISNNGLVSFGTGVSGVSSFSPAPFPISGLPPIITPYWADVDTRTAKGTYTNKVWYKVYSDRVVVIWDSVGYYDNHTDQLCKFELTLFDNSHPLHQFGSNWDVRWTWDTLSWDRGDVNAATSYPVTGFQDGKGNYFNFPGSATGRIPIYPGPASKVLLLDTFRDPQSLAALPVVPAISYPDSIFYTAGTAITPVAVANTGGAVPATRYGSVTTYAGSSSGMVDNTTALNAKFSKPGGLASDRLGNVYVADWGNGRTRKIDAAGNVTSTTISTNENSGMGFATDITGYLYKAYGPGALAQGRYTYTTIAPYTYKMPTGITVDTKGNVYIADRTANRIWFSTSSGNATTVSMGYMNPVYAGTGTAGSANGAAAVATFNQPAGIALDTVVTGNIYVADMGNNQIRKITSAGVVSLFAGSVTGVAGKTDGTGSAALFNKPTALITDRLGNVYVSDSGNNVIRKITPAGVVTTLAGSSVAGLKDTTVSAAAMFKGLAGIAIDSLGNVLVSDGGNSRIRKIATTGYTITPALPAGFRFDSTTGTISGTSAVILTPATYTVIAYNMGGTDTTTFVLAAAPLNPLVIKLGEISAVNKGSVNEVRWNSVSEETGDAYQVERSAGGVHFIILDTMPGKYTMGGNYTYTDRSPITGINYYRLKLLNSNGSSGYSKTVSATNKGSFGISLFPNPVKSEVTITINGTISGNAMVRIYDVLGKQYKSTKASGQQTTVSMNGLPPGLYLLQYQDDQHKESFQVAKE